jgi:ankyrin repeat protein
VKVGICTYSHNLNHHIQGEIAMESLKNSRYMAEEGVLNPSTGGSNDDPSDDDANPNLRPPPASESCRKRRRRNKDNDCGTTEQDEEESAAAAAALELAPTLQDYLKDGGVLRYRPRPEWYAPNSISSRKPSRASSSSRQLSHGEDDGSSSDREELEDDPNLPHNRDNASVASSQAVALSMNNNALEPNNNHRSTNNNTAIASNANSTVSRTTTTPSTFGKDFDPAILVAVRDGATDAVLSLLNMGAPVESENAKGCTPLILAAQKGNLRLVRELLQRGASPKATTVTGTTAVLQAAHFGHLDIVKALLEKGGTNIMELANYNHTTPLMRAAQEGHCNVVKFLLEKGALVNRRNQVHMTSLMLASQRGHDKMCSLLIAFGADLDVMTAQKSSSLHLACKRNHKEVARILVTAGAEICSRDHRGRTPRDLALRRLNNDDMANMMDPLMQVDMMQRHARKQRSFEIVKIWNLLQQERAVVTLEQGRTPTIHQLSPLLESQQHGLPIHLSQSSTLALMRTMTLPAPLVRLITEFMSLPTIWEKRIGLLTRRCLVDSDATVLSALDLLDEIIEEAGFLEACDAANVPPPSGFDNWVSLDYGQSSSLCSV